MKKNYLTRIIHVVRCLQIQGRDGFAILEYANPLKTKEMLAHRCASVSNLASTFKMKIPQSVATVKCLTNLNNHTMSIRYFSIAELLMNYPG